MSLITRILPPDEKGFKLTFQEMDNNLYYLQSLGVSGLTFSANTLTITNPTGGTKSVIINAGVTFTGGTVSGATSFTNGLSANIISATTYQNLPIDIRVTGGTYSAGTATFKNNTGGTFNVTGFLTGVTDTYVTGGTYSNGTATFTNNSGSTFNVSGFYTGDTTLITGATNVGTGITIFDSVVNRSLQINSITGDTLEKITTSLSNNTIQLDVNEQNLTLWDLVVQGNRLLNGNVSYISGLTFNVSPLEYLINGTIYDITSATTVTLNSGDSTYDRIDVIYADINGNTGVLEGTPSENPEKPIVDGFSQVEVTFVLVPANSIIPDINQVIVYNENLGPPNEWTFGSVGLQPTRIIGSSTDQAYTGSTSIRVSGVTGAFTTSFRLTGNTILDTNQYATLQFAIRNLSANTTTSQISLRFLSTGGTQNGNTVFMNAAGSSGFVQYTSTNTSSWQLISIPLWRFYLTNTNVQVVEFSFNNPNARYYFDLIEFVAGTSSSPPSNSWTTIKGDGTTTITAPNPNSTLSVLGGTNIGSTILGTSSVVLNLDNNIILTGVTANTVSATTYQNLPTDVRVTGASYSNNTFTYTNNTGGTFNTSFNTVTGLTVNGNLNVTGNTNIGGTLTANTISANTLNINGVNITGDTYVTGLTFNTGNYNLTIGRNDGVTFTDSLGILAGDLSVTGGTYDIFTGDATFTNNTGGTFIVSGFLVGYTDLLVTGATYNNNTFTFKNSSGGTFNVSFNTVTGLTSTGTIQSSILSATTYQNLPDNVTGNYLPLSGGTVIGSTNFTNGLTANTISATTYQNLPDNVTGNYLPISGGTVTGQTVFNQGVTADTISATTYQNLPDNVTGNYLPISGGTVTGSTSFTNGLTASTISATTYFNLPTYDYEIHVSAVDGNDTTGNGDLLNPVATITKALTLLTGSRKTIIVHPGTYSENVTVANTNTTISTSELTGANTLLSGTLTIGTLGSGTRISGLKMSNLVISGTAQAYISNCTVDTQVTKSSSGFVEIINSEMQCISGIQISGSGTTIINGNKNVGISVSNASAQVIVKGCNSVVTPSASAGNLSIVDCIVTALGGDGITITGALTTLTLINSQVLVTAGNNVAPISVAGIYTIINTIYDKPSSTLTGTSTNSIDYFQYINADKFITQGGTSSQYVMGDGSLSNGFTGGTVSGSTIFTNGLSANTISATTYQNLPISGLTEGNNINISGSNGNFTISVTGLTQGLTGEYLPLSGGTVSGDTTITANLTVSGNSGINWFSSNTSSDLVRITQTGVGNAFVVDDSTNPDTTPFVINSGGSVSIGTTNVFSVGGAGETKLNISNGSSGVATTGLPVSTPLIVESNLTTSIGMFSTNSDVSQIYFGTPGDVFGGFLRWDFTNKNLILSTANTTGKLIFQTQNSVEAARIDSNGNMGIGLTGATQKLEVSGNTKIYGTLNIGTIGSGTSVINLGLDVNGNVVTGTTGGGGTFTGGTVSGATNFTNGLTANTISATTYLNLPQFSGGSVSGPTNFTNGLTANTISATTYQNLPVTADTFVTAFTYSNNTFTIGRNQGLTPLTSLINTVTGLTINGNLTVTGDTGLGTSSPTRKLTVSGDSTFIHNPINSLTSSVQGYGDVVTFGTGSLTAGTLCYYTTGGAWTLADADSTSTSTGLLGIALGTSATTNGVLIRGYVRSSTYTATTGQILYVSQTAGSITATPPSTSGKVVRILGYHIDTNTDTMYFDPSKDWLEL